MSDVRVFVSYDLEHDRELYALIIAQSKTQSSGFVIVGSSERPPAHLLCSEKTMNSIGEANQVIVICGEHSESSEVMSAELQVALQEGKPYFLLWGRREIMCSKPTGAKSSDGMYSWTLPILQEQMELMKRSAKWKTPTDEFKSAAKNKRPAEDPPYA